MRLIDADPLYTQLQKNEELARKRVLDTESFLPYPNNLNPSYTRYVAQMDERMRLKHMVADAPTIEQRKMGKWTRDNTCPFCGFQPWYERDIHTLSFCPNCGADMRGDQDDKN